MANHTSAIKRNRQSEKRTTFNRWWRSRVRSSVKSVLEAVESGDKKKAEPLLVATIKEIDKASSKGVYHKKTASRKVARLSKKVSALS